MQINHTLEYDASPDEVFEMLADPAYRDKVCAAQQAHTSDVSIEPTAVGMSVLVDQKRPSEGLPGFARKFVGDEIQIVQREQWSNRSTAKLAVTIPGKPGEMNGSIELVAAGTGTVETVRGELKVNIPLVGGKLEGLIAQMLEEALSAEERVGKGWLAGER